MANELRWSDDASVVLLEDSVVLARLPDGPVWVIEGTGSQLVRQMVGTFTADALVDWAVEVFEGDHGVIRSGVDDFLDMLCGVSLLIDA